jgi:hypothetical protein
LSVLEAFVPSKSFALAHGHYLWSLPVAFSAFLQQFF